MQRRARTAQVNFRTFPELKAAAERAAAADNRSLTSLIEMLLLEHVRALGYCRSNGHDPGSRLRRAGAADSAQT